MKYSGIEWIGYIPDGWVLDRLQWHLDEIKESNDPVKTTQVLSLTNKLGVIPYEEKGEQGNKAKENVNEYKLAYPNTIVANSMNILIGSVGKCDYFGCVSPVYYVFKPKENENIDFLNYIFQTTQFQRELRRYANGILEIRLRVSAADILKRKIAFPSLNEQIQIVSFLKNKTAEIDSLIEIENQQIDRIREYKKAAITKVMTKGLCSERTYSTGIEWIGDINSRFSVCPLKFLLKGPLMYGAGESGDKSINYYRYIRITDIDGKGNLKNTDDNLYLSESAGMQYELHEGDVLFARSGGTVGKSFIYRACYGKCAFAGYLIKATCDVNKIIPEYLYYYTQSSIYESWKDAIFIQATIQNIGATKYSMLPVIVPSVDEQKDIVKYINEICIDLDNLLLVKQQKIELLNEYKKALTYEIVTGKKEVTA